LIRRYATAEEEHNVSDNSDCEGENWYDIDNENDMERLEKTVGSKEDDQEKDAEEQAAKSNDGEDNGEGVADQQGGSEAMDQEE
jgi:NDP-sugar pyrophosphorylase family protein